MAKTVSLKPYKILYHRQDFLKTVCKFDVVFNPNPTKWGPTGPQQYINVSPKPTSASKS